MIFALEELSRLYGDLGASLCDDSERNPHAEAPDAVESILRSAQLIHSMEQASERLTALAAWWEQHRERLAPGDRDRVHRLAESTRTRVARILACCDRHSALLLGRKAGIEENLCRIRKGVRFLQSTRPPRTNYPKFIDSRG